MCLGFNQLPCDSTTSLDEQFVTETGFFFFFSFKSPGFLSLLISSCLVHLCLTTAEGNQPWGQKSSCSHSALFGPESRHHRSARWGLGFGFGVERSWFFLFVCFIVLCVIVKLMICVVEGSFFFSYFFCFTLSNCNVCSLVLDFFFLFLFFF